MASKLSDIAAQVQKILREKELLEKSLILKEERIKKLQVQLEEETKRIGGGESMTPGRVGKSMKILPRGTIEKREELKEIRAQGKPSERLAELGGKIKEGLSVAEKRGIKLRNDKKLIGEKISVLTKKLKDPPKTIANKPDKLAAWKKDIMDKIEQKKAKQAEIEAELKKLK